MSRVHFVGDVKQGGEPVPFDPAAHFPALALAASRLPDLRLMIVDPIVSAVAGDSHHNAEVRRGLQPLVTFAEQAGCALIGVTHFTKGTQGREPLERVTGSLGFGAVARIVLGTAKMKDEDGGGRRIAGRHPRQQAGDPGRTGGE
jgi:putative DNA primase/helicase